MNRIIRMISQRSSFCHVFGSILDDKKGNSTINVTKSQTLTTQLPTMKNILPKDRAY